MFESANELQELVWFMSIIIQALNVKWKCLWFVRVDILSMCKLLNLFNAFPDALRGKEKLSKTNLCVQVIKFYTLEAEALERLLLILSSKLKGFPHATYEL